MLAAVEDVVVYSMGYLGIRLGVYVGEALAVRRA